MFVIIPLLANIKVCTVSFQMPSISHLIKILIFLYREEIPIFYPLLNMLQMNFRKTFFAVTRIAAYTNITFLPHLKHVHYHTKVSVFNCQRRDCRMKHHLRSFAFFFTFWIFQKRFWLFRGKFLDFTSIISKLFRKVTDKF